MAQPEETENSVATRGDAAKMSLVNYVAAFLESRNRENEYRASKDRSATFSVSELFYSSWLNINICLALQGYLHLHNSSKRRGYVRGKLAFLSHKRENPRDDPPKGAKIPMAGRRHEREPPECPSISS